MWGRGERLDLHDAKHFINGCEGSSGAQQIRAEDLTICVEV